MSVFSTSKDRTMYVHETVLVCTVCSVRYYMPMHSDYRVS